MTLDPWAFCPHDRTIVRLDQDGQVAVVLSPPSGPGTPWHMCIRAPIDLARVAIALHRLTGVHPSDLQLHASGSSAHMLATWADTILRAAGVSLSTHLWPADDQHAAIVQAVDDFQAHARDAAAWADQAAADIARKALDPRMILSDPEAAMDGVALSFQLTGRAMRIRELAGLAPERRGLDPDTVAAFVLIV